MMIHEATVISTSLFRLSILRNKTKKKGVEKKISQSLALRKILSMDEKH